MMASPARIRGSMIPLLYVRDMPAAVGFYRDTLGFRFRGWWDERKRRFVRKWIKREKPEFAALAAGDMRLFLHAARTGRRSPPILHLNVREVDRYWGKARSRGLSAEPPRDMPWGWRQFFATDPDGHEWSFFREG